VKLTLNLAVNDSHAPVVYNSGDLDFGATPLLFQRASCDPMLAVMQKSGMLYIYDRNKIGSGPIAQFQIGVSTPAGSFVGIPAFDPVLNQIYVNNPVDSANNQFKTGLVALSVTPAPTCAIVTHWNPGTGTSSGSNPSIPPVAANGVVYYGDGVGSVLRAVDAQNGQVLWTSNMTTDHITGGIFASPSVVNGQVFVAGFDHKIHAYGL
jgi:outer membrane protein assembly factor BamB